MSRPLFTVPPPPEPNQCWGCGCTDQTACVDPDTRQPCHWVKADFCSVCALLFADLVIKTGEKLRATAVLEEGSLICA